MRSPRPSFARRLAFAATLVSLAACSDTVEPDAGRALTGQYLAAPASANGPLSLATFTTTMGGVVVDRLALGATITLALRPDGTTTGHLHMPLRDDEREPGDGAALDADLAGTWKATDGVVRLTHSADTFLRDTPLAVRGDRLEGERQFGDVTVRIVLVRQ